MSIYDMEAKKILIRICKLARTLDLYKDSFLYTSEDIVEESKIVTEAKEPKLDSYNAFLNNDAPIFKGASKPALLCKRRSKSKYGTDLNQLEPCYVTRHSNGSGISETSDRNSENENTSTGNFNV